MDAQTAIERITETENLTDELEDDDADTLLNWGISLVPQVLARAGKDEEKSGNAINHLMAVIRSINRLMVERTSLTSDALASAILTLIDQYNDVLGTSVSTESDALDKAAAAIHSGTPHEALQQVFNLVQPATEAPQKE